MPSYVVSYAYLVFYNYACYIVPYTYVSSLLELCKWSPRTLSMVHSHISLCPLVTATLSTYNLTYVYDCIGYVCLVTMQYCLLIYNTLHRNLYGRIKAKAMLYFHIRIAL